MHRSGMRKSRCANEYRAGFLQFIGNPAVALFIAIIIAILRWADAADVRLSLVMDIVGESIGAIACFYHRGRRRAF